MDAPEDADARRAVAPVLVYDGAALPAPAPAPEPGPPVETVDVPAREGRCVRVPRGAILRLSTPHGSQVGDLGRFGLEDGLGSRWNVIARK